MKLETLREVTHIFYAAYQDRPKWTDLEGPNLAMLMNVVETVEPATPYLQHINLMQGYKVYGAHLGPFKTPARESDPNHMPPEFNVAQQAYLEDRQRGKAWSWSALRPSIVIGLAMGNPMNLGMVIAIFSAMSKELHLPLRFPGRLGAYRALLQVTDANLLAKAMVWAATSDRCANEAFNIANGDLFRWEELWPKFAHSFGIDLAPPLSLSLTDTMAGKEFLWDAMVKKYSLRPHSYKELVSWRFGDVVFSRDWDFFGDIAKSHRFGFHEFVDSEKMFLDLFASMRQQRIIP
jgi:nucleoside-diphosphate-sugar epimerase